MSTLPSPTPQAPDASARVMDARVAVLALGTFAIGTESLVIAGILPQLAADLDVGLGRAGLLVTLFAVAYAVSAPVLGVALSGVGRRAVLVGAMALFTVSNVAAALAPSYGLLAVARLIAGVAAAAYTPAAVSAAVWLLPPSLRGRAASVVFAGLSIALVTAVPLGTFVAHLADWRATFVLVAAVSAVGTVGVALLLPAISGSPAARLRDRLLPLRRLDVAVALAAAFVWMTGAFIFYTFISRLVVEATGWPVASLGPVLLGYGVFAVVGNWLGGRATDGPLGDGGTLRVALSALFVAYLVLAVAVRLGPPVGVVTGSVALIVLAVAGWACTAPQSYRMMRLAPTATAEVLGLNTMANYLGVSAGSALGALLVERRPAVSLALAAAVCQLLGLAGVWFVDRLRRPVATRPAEPVLPAGAVTPAKPQA